MAIRWLPSDEPVGDSTAHEARRLAIQYADDPGTYRAGACNIGPEEIARRRRGGLTGVGLAVLLGVILVAVGAPPWLRLLVFPLLAGGLVSLEQARRHFCVGFALAGIRNFGPLGDPDRVSDVADRVADRRAALVMTGYMSAIAAVLTLAFVVLPI
jgi:hypothetical protein